MCRPRTILSVVCFVAVFTILWTRDFPWLRFLKKPKPFPLPEMMNESSSDLPDRLLGLGHTIEELMKIGGTVGLSMGVLHNGKPVYHANYGYRDVQKKLEVTKDTIFPACSLSKALTSATMALLVDDGKVTWDTVVKDVLPGFKINDSVLQNHMTITDLLAHRTGMAWGDNLYVGTNNNVLISKEDSLKYIASQDRLLPFRGQFSYNNINYELAGHVIRELTGSVFEETLQKRILGPIGADRTFFETPKHSFDNVATCYNVFDDGTPTPPISCPKGGDNGFGAPSGGVKTTVNDLLKIYSVFLKSFNDQFSSGKTSTEGSPFRRVPDLTSSKIPMDQPSQYEESYAFGWARAQLPARMGNVGCNPPLMPDGMPIVGKGLPSQLVLYHQGSLPGALAIVILIPESESAVVVLTNTLTLNDTPDWVGQLVLEEILGVPHEHRNDFVAAAKQSVAENAKWYPNTHDELKKQQKEGTKARELQEYVGTYWDAPHVFKIDVLLEDGQLFWKFQDLESEKWPLSHYQDDSFIWLQPRNKLAERGRWVDQPAVFWRADFQSKDGNKIDRLFWVHDDGTPPVEYIKAPSASL